MPDPTLGRMRLSALRLLAGCDQALSGWAWTNRADTGSLRHEGVSHDATGVRVGVVHGFRSCYDAGTSFSETVEPEDN